MKTKTVIDSLTALARKSRLAVFRHLVQAGPSGARSGDIADALGMRPSTLSFHLKALRHASLIATERAGPEIIYRADFKAIQGLVDYLTDNRCGGDASQRAPNCAPVQAS